MADKRLAEQNQRWLRNTRKQIAELHELVVLETVQCTREAPDVEWAQIEKEIDRLKASVTYVRQQTDKKAVAA